jgi:hypothetical protein
MAEHSMLKLAQMKRTVPSRKFFPRALVPAFTLVITLGLFVRSVQANYIVMLQEIGPSVVATGSGVIDLTGLTFRVSAGTSSGILPTFGDIFVGPTSGSGSSTDDYDGATGPTSFGVGGRTDPSNGSGDLVGIGGGAGFLVVPQGYVSGSPLSSSSTYTHTTFDRLGVTAGTYIWTWGTGPDQNFTLQIDPNRVADTGSTLGVLLLALVIVFGVRQLSLA